MPQQENNRKINILILINMIIFDLFSIISIINNHKICENEKPIDYILKNDLNQCYLTIHNLISIITTIDDNNKNAKEFNISNNEEFKAYIYSYSRPYLLELIQNSTEDCLCCNKLTNNSNF